MTINDLLATAMQHQAPIGLYFLVVPLATRLLGLAHGGTAGERTGYRYLYSAFIYLVSFPGALACVMTGYSLFFIRQDLRDVPLVLYALPILSMFVTWRFLRRQAELDALPGFRRLSGFLWVVFGSFVLAFLLNRLFFGVLFFGSLWGLFGAVALLFAALEIGARRLLGPAPKG